MQLLQLTISQSNHCGFNQVNPSINLH